MANDIQALAQIDYTARDFAGYQAALFAFATRVFPEWTSRNPADFGVMFVEQMAYIGDIMSFYQDAIANETFLATATQRDSVIAIATQLGYTPQIALPATGSVTFATAAYITSPVIVPAYTQLITAFSPALDRPVTFETNQDVSVPAAGGTASVAITEGITQGNRAVNAYGAGVGVPGISKVEDLGISSGNLFQSFTLAIAPVLIDSVRVFVETPIASGGIQVAEWRKVDNWLSSVAGDQVFRLSVADSGQGTVSFGDGINGAIPPAGLKICAGYRTGGGAYGNLNANSLVDFAATISGVNISSSTAMNGGADNESINSIRVNAPKLFRTQDRAVSVLDYGNLALSVPGIQSANAVANSQNTVTIYCLGPNNAIPSQTQLDLVQKTVTAKSLGGVAVTVQAGTPIQVNIGSNADPTLYVTIGVNPRFKRGTTQLAATSALQTILSATYTNLGMRLSVSNLYAILEATAGIDYSLIPVMARADGAQLGNADILFRAWEVPVVGNIYINPVGGAI